MLRLASLGIWSGVLNVFSVKVKKVRCLMRLLISCFVTLILASCGGGGGGGGGGGSTPAPNRAPVVTDPGALTLL